MNDFLRRLGGFEVPAFPIVQWGTPLKYVPHIRDVAKGLYEAVFWLGVSQGFSFGLTLGVVLGVVATVAVWSLIYWSVFKPTRSVEP